MTPPSADFIDILKRRWPIATFSLAAVAAVALPFLSGLPPLYRASATILVEGQLFDEASEWADAVARNIRLQSIGQEALSRARLTGLLNRFDLYPRLRQRGALEDAVVRFQRDIHIEVTRTSAIRGDLQTVAFRLSYIGSTPETAADVANSLAAFYVNENDSLRSRAAAYRTEVLQKSLDDANKRLAEQEQRLSAFSARDPGSLPRQLDINVAALTRTSQELQANTGEQRRIRERRQMLLNQIAEARNRLDGSSGPERRLPELQKELAELRLHETINSPNVRAKEREIAAVNQELRDVARKSGDGKHTASPTVDSGQLEIAQLDSELEKLVREAKSLKNILSQYQSRLDTTPGRTAEFEAIMHDYRAAQEEYATLQTRHNDALRAQQAERVRSRAEFRIVDSAFPPSGPSGPNRVFWSILALTFAAALSAAIAVVVDRLDTSFHSVDELRAFTRVPVLASIPVINTPADERRWRRRVMACCVGGTLLLALIATATFNVAASSDGIARLLLRIV